MWINNDFYFTDSHFYTVDMFCNNTDYSPICIILEIVYFRLLFWELLQVTSYFILASCKCIVCICLPSLWFLSQSVSQSVTNMINGDCFIFVLFEFLLSPTPMWQLCKLINFFAFSQLLSAVRFYAEGNWRLYESRLFVSLAIPQLAIA